MAADREENVYKAKLAEQAERYDGRFQYRLSLRSVIEIVFKYKFKDNLLIL